MNQTVLITGASGGIGYELALLFAKERYNLVLVARNSEVLNQMSIELSKIYGISVTVIAKDLSVPSTPQEIYEELYRESVTIDVLVNNAGFGHYGLFHEHDLTTDLAMLQVNITALTHLCKLFLPAMIRRGSGKILNVASTAAFLPGPLMAVYYASKAYVLHYSEALANELQETGVSVTTLCPGPTQTDFQTRAHMEQSKIMQRTIMDATTVARMGYTGMMNKQTVVVAGFKNKLLVNLVRFLPRKIVTATVRRIQNRRK